MCCRSSSGGGVLENYAHKKTSNQHCGSLAGMFTILKMDVAAYRYTDVLYPHA